METTNEPIKQPQHQEGSTPTSIKTIPSRSNLFSIIDNEAIYHFKSCLSFITQLGRSIYGQHFKINKEDHLIIYKLLIYFIQDHDKAKRYNLNLSKGIMLSGPVGSGKTSLMNLMRYFVDNKSRHIIRSCREISFEFINHGYDVVLKYSSRSFNHTYPKTYCFDDLGTEQNLKYYGNDCNTMAEILLSRYDQYISHGMLTHITTNLSATEIEDYYGNRVRSRMREMFNLLSFGKDAKDKRI